MRALINRVLAPLERDQGSRIAQHRSSGVGTTISKLRGLPIARPVRFQIVLLEVLNLFECSSERRHSCPPDGLIMHQRNHALSLILFHQTQKAGRTGIWLVEMAIKM